MEAYPYFKDYHKDVREIARSVARELRDKAFIADEKEDYTIIEGNLKRLAELGLLSIKIPSEYGGQGLDNLSYIIALEEISRACASTALSYDAYGGHHRIWCKRGTKEKIPAKTSERRDRRLRVIRAHSGL
jgi:alkylation response protein AidB-like acyl-CoA dehydrogenase